MAAPDRRRAFRRFEQKLEISLGSASRFFTGTTKNISEGGLFVATRELKPIGAELTLTFHLPGRSHPIRVLGTVRWIRDNDAQTSDAPLGMGVKFQHLTPDDRRAIQAYLRLRPPLIVDDDDGAQGPDI